jgi:hypothetical protein
MPDIPLIIMVGGDKGGTGKSHVARALCDYMADRKVPCRVFDTESPAGDLKRFRPDAEIIDISRVKDQMRVFDGIDVGTVTIVDIRAGLLSPTLFALDQAKLLDDVRSGAICLVVLHLLGPTISSLNEIAEAARTIGGGARHMIVKNHINDTSFDIARDPRYADHFARMSDVTIDVPKLTENATEAVQQAGSTFVDFANGTGSRTLRGYVKTWLESVWREFDRIGLGKLADSARLV